jgi:hypothetical protein
VLTLSPAEIAEVTGRTRLHAQAAELAKRGIPFIFRGKAIEVSREVAKAFAMVPNTPTRRGLDFSLIR